MAKPKQPRKEVVSFRLEPKIKYLVDIAARIQRRSPTNYIENTLEDSLKSVEFKKGTSVYDMSNDLWSDEEALRVLTLAIKSDGLLTHDELATVQLALSFYPDIIENGQLNISAIISSEISRDWTKLTHAASGDLDALSYFRDKHNITRNVLSELKKPSNKTMEDVESFIKAMLLKVPAKTIEESKTRSAFRMLEKYFLIDRDMEATIENIDTQKVLDSWQILHVSAMLSSIRYALIHDEELFNHMNKLNKE